MRRLNYELKRLGQQGRDGSYATQAKRARTLSQMADELYALGFHQMGARSLKPKHAEALVQHWSANGIAAATIKNRMSTLRWWAQKVGKVNVVGSNDSYGIAERQYVTQVSKAVALDAPRLAAVSDARVRMSLELQAAFGLRREEAIKFRPQWADQGGHIVLRASWTKGGKARTVPVRDATQRAVLERAKALVGPSRTASLIPAALMYRDQLRRYEDQCRQAGLHKMHGLRHAYAQARYEALTGWAAPALGGPRASALTPEQKATDLAARLAISRELGHEREQITAVYLGR